MDDSIKQLSFDQLRTLHREIGALIAERRTEELEALREKMSLLGFTVDELAVKKNGKAKYKNPETGEVWSGGRGRKPKWLADALEQGRQLDEFAVAT